MEPPRRATSPGAVFGSRVRRLTQLLVHVDPGGWEPEEARGERGTGAVLAQSPGLWLWGSAGGLGEGPAAPEAPEPGKACGCAPAVAVATWNLLCTEPTGRGEAAGGQCAGPACGALLSLVVSLGRWEGGEEQGGAGQACEGDGGEVKQLVEHLAVLAWCGAAAGSAWRAGCGAREGMWDLTLDTCSAMQGLTVAWAPCREDAGLYLAFARPGGEWGQPFCACYLGRAQASAFCHRLGDSYSVGLLIAVLGSVLPPPSL